MKLLNLKPLWQYPLLSGSLVMIIGTNLISALSYLYHVFVSRWLSPSNYGELSVLLSILGLMGIIPSAIGMVVTKYISHQQNKANITSLVYWFNRKALIMASLILVIFILVSPLIQYFLDIKSLVLIWLTGVVFFFSLPTMLNWAILQGLLKFKEYVLCNLVGNSSKLFFSLGFLLVGLNTTGAFIGIVCSSIINYSTSRWFLKDYLKKINRQPQIEGMFQYSLPVISNTFAVTSIYSTDLILVKHFFNSEQAGIYAAVSLLSRIIFFSIAPISGVMFPLVSNKYATGQNYKIIFWLSMGLSFVVGSLIIIFFKYLPNLAILSLVGPNYLAGQQLLFNFGLFIFIFTLAYLAINYYLSIGKTKIVVLPIVAAISQVILICLYHSSLVQVINMSLLVSSLLLFSLLVYFWYDSQSTRLISNSSRI